MNVFRKLACSYKYNYYSAKVNTIAGYQMSVVLAGAFLLAVVLIGLTEPSKAFGVFIVISLWLAVYPFIFPKQKTDSDQ